MRRSATRGLMLTGWLLAAGVLATTGAAQQEPASPGSAGADATPGTAAGQDASTGVGTGDPRSEGAGPGIVGSPIGVRGGGVLLGVVTAVLTLLVARWRGDSPEDPPAT